MKKRWLSLAMVAILVIGLIAAGTLSYFTSTDSKTNVFTLGKVKIELTEPEWDKLDDEDTVLVPGREIEKDPTVTVKADSEDAYVRVKVVIPSKLLSVLKPITFGNKWSRVGTTDFYLYNDVVTKSGADTVLQEVFTSVEVKTDADFTGFTEDDLEIVITAYAIQAEGFADPAAAWAAFDVAP